MTQSALETKAAVSRTTSLRICRKSTRLRSCPDCGVRAVGAPSASRRLCGGTLQDLEVCWIASRQLQHSSPSLSYCRLTLEPDIITFTSSDIFGHIRLSINIRFLLEQYLSGTLFLKPASTRILSLHSRHGFVTRPERCAHPPSS